jgi:hypothetical protein
MSGRPSKAVDDSNSRVAGRWAPIDGFVYAFAVRRSKGLRKKVVPLGRGYLSEGLRWP